MSSGCNALRPQRADQPALGGCGSAAARDGNGKQRQVIGERARAWSRDPALPASVSTDFRARDHRCAEGPRVSPPECRRSGPPIPATPHAGRQRRPSPFLDAHRGVEQARQVAPRARSVHGNAWRTARGIDCSHADVRSSAHAIERSVEGRGAAADLIQDHQRRARRPD